MERRSSVRMPVNLMVNKYIDGYPYACRALDLSQGGILIEPIAEPAHRRDAYPLEIGLPGMVDRIWVWARSVGARGRSQALRFMAMDAFDQILLDQILEEAAARQG